MKPKNDEQRREHDDEHDTDSTSNNDGSVDEIAERIVSTHFGHVSEPSSEQDDDIEDGDPPLLSSDGGIIYTSGLHAAGQFLSPMAESEEQAATRAKQSPELLLRKAEVRLLAESIFGGRAASMQWMEKPLTFAFDGKRPAEVMATLEGCDEVEVFLRSMYS